MEKLGLPIKILLFFSAYSPLFLILVIKNIELFSNYHKFYNTWSFWLVLIPFIFAIIACIFFVIFIKFNENKAADSEYVLLNYNDTASQSISYIITYIIPFLDFNLSYRYDILCVYVLLVVIGIIYINTDLIHSNPLLYVLGYSAFDTEVKDIRNDVTIKSTLLVKREYKFDLYKNDLINTALINNNCKYLLLFKSKTRNI